MDSKFISSSLSTWYRFGGMEEFALNIYLKDWESDFINITKAGYIHEYEIKVDRYDFHADFKKFKSIYVGKDDDFKYIYEDKFKHELIKNGEYGIKTFSFVTPHGLVEPSEIPKYCGHIEVYESGDVKELIKAPILLNAKKLTNQEHQKLYNYYKWRWRKGHFEGIENNG